MRKRAFGSGARATHAAALAGEDDDGETVETADAAIGEGEPVAIGDSVTVGEAITVVSADDEVGVGEGEDAAVHVSVKEDDAVKDSDTV